MVAVTDKTIGTSQGGGQRGPGKASRSLWSRLLRPFRGLIGRDRYEPAKYYMRGPGPASLRRANEGENTE
jgi:hypothetical protein